MSDFRELRINQLIRGAGPSSGGGGGSTAWGSIIGLLSSQTDLQSALNAKANSSDVTTALSGKQNTLVSGTSIKTINGTSVLGSGDIVISSGSNLSGISIVTVPNNSLSWTQTVSATGVTPSSVVVTQIAPHDDSDENDSEMLDVMAMSARPGTDQITFTLAFATSTAGPIKLAWRA